MKYTKQSGRSMIEMLGVLAIIAVLSVGGIAGYSKAMSAYKLNKWTSQIREMIANTQTLYMNQKAYSYNAANLMNTLMAAEAIPQGMLDENNRDSYGNSLSVSITSKKSVVAGERIMFMWRLPQTKSSIDCCAKLYELGQYYYNSLWLVAIAGDFSYTICGKMSPEAWLDDQKCQPYDFIKAKQHCKKCENQNCRMLFIMDDSAFQLISDKTIAKVGAGILGKAIKSPQGKAILYGAKIAYPYVETGSANIARAKVTYDETCKRKK